MKEYRLVCQCGFNCRSDDAVSPYIGCISLVCCPKCYHPAPRSGMVHNGWSIHLMTRTRPEDYRWWKPWTWEEWEWKQ